MNHKILMVCLGNICRSPLAEGILRSKLSDEIFIDSAGTGGWHIGQNPDPRSVQVAKNHGIDISKQKARQIELIDLDRFDLIFVMDTPNYKNMIEMTTRPDQESKIRRILGNSDVPDPYFGDETDFEYVFELLDAATDKLIEQFKLL